MMRTRAKVNSNARRATKVKRGEGERWQKDQTLTNVSRKTRRHPEVHQNIGQHRKVRKPKQAGPPAKTKRQGEPQQTKAAKVAGEKKYRRE